MAESVAANRLPLHVVASSRTSTHRALGLRLHSAPRTIGSIERRTSPGATVVRAPASLTCPDSIVEAVEGAGSGAVDKGSVAQDGNMVEAEVPDRGEDHTVAAEGHESTDDGAGEDVIPVVVLVNSQGTADQASTEEGSVESSKLPHSGVVVGEDLELGVEVEVQKDEAGEGSGGVARGHGLECVIDLLLVARADATVEHDGAEAVGDIGAGGASGLIGVGVEGKAGWDDGLADSEEVRAETCIGQCLLSSRKSIGDAYLQSTT